MKTSKPPNAGKGRPKGSPNRITRDVREMILGSLEDVGGRAYLARQAFENPSAYMGLVKGIVPKDIVANVKSQTEIVDKRREIDAIVDALLSPGAVQRSPEGAPLLNLPDTPPAESRLNRADGRGAPTELAPDSA